MHDTRNSESLPAKAAHTATTSAPVRRITAGEISSVICQDRRQSDNQIINQSDNEIISQIIKQTDYQQSDNQVINQFDFYKNLEKSDDETSDTETHGVPLAICACRRLSL